MKTFTPRRPRHISWDLTSVALVISGLTALVAAVIGAVS